MLHNLLDIRNIFQRYGKGGWVLRGLNLTIREHEIVALAGESGSGKSTLLRIIAGMERIADGTIHIGGQVISSSTMHVPSEKRRVGLIFQEPSLFPHLTVRHNILFGLHTWDGPTREARLAQLLALLKIEGIAGRYPHQISGGQIQRVTIARAIAPRPHLLLLDEPFNNLDVSLRESILPDIQELIKREGITALCITHLAQEAFAIADRIAVLNKGVIEQCASPQSIYRRPKSYHVASFFGIINRLPIIYDCEQRQISLIDGRYSAPVSTLPAHTRRNIFELLIRPDALEIFSVDEVCHRPDMLLIPARITTITYYGHYQSVRATVVSSTERISVQVDGRVALKQNALVQIGLPINEAHIIIRV